jgi:hypothetical protein
MSPGRKGILCHHGAILASLLFVILEGKNLQAQVQWTASNANPVFERGNLGSWDFAGVFVNSFLKQGGEYQMWYGALGQHGAGLSDMGWQIGCAHSMDRTVWERNGPTACFPISPGDWDQGHFQPCVLFDSDEGIFKMWYIGGPGSDFLSPTSVGYATSLDGKNWVPLGRPVLEATEDWEHGNIASPEVLFDASKRVYRMWYQGIDWFNCGTRQIGYAESATGIEWTKCPKNPISGLDGTSLGLESFTGAYWPKVRFDEAASVFEMWYETLSLGCGSLVLYATSLDGITWVPNSEPLVFQGESNEVSAGPVLVEGDFYHMLYKRVMGFTVADVGYAISPWTLPKASFTVSPETGPDPFEVTVDASRSVTPAPPIVSYAWDFGDGTPAASGMKASHIYTQSGEYLLKLTVADEAHQMGSVARKVSVSFRSESVAPWLSEEVGTTDDQGGARPATQCKGMEVLGAVGDIGLTRTASTLFTRSSTGTFE